MTERLINRITLRHLADLRMVPQTGREIAEYVQGRIRRPCEYEVETALCTLEAAGYVARCEATAADRPLWKITATGLRQALQAVPRAELDPLVWGD
jgi:hypothetical protein